MKSSKQLCKLDLWNVFLPIKWISLREIKKIVKYNHFTETTARVLPSILQVTWSLETGDYEPGLKARETPRFQMTAIELVPFPLGPFIYLCLRSDLFESLGWLWTYSYNRSDWYYKCWKLLTRLISRSRWQWTSRHLTSCPHPFAMG